MNKVILKTFTHSLAFVLGFSVVFVFGFGVPASAISLVLTRNERLIGIIGGIIIILLGIHITGSLWGITPFRFLMREKALHLSSKPSGYIGSFLVGVFFSAGWTPCVGPILAAILTIAASTKGAGVPMMIAYSAGLALPFLIISLAFNTFISKLQLIRRFIPAINVISGLLLIGVGILLMSGGLVELNKYFARIGTFTGEQFLAGYALNLGIAFLGGLLSFLSPCVLPMVPSYIFYITGLTFSDFQPKKA